jgi:DtxR family Mn-dependent transcriptional regulator
METQTADLTVAVQDYLKAIYALESAGERVTTSALAARVGVSAPSATAMTKRLAELGLVERAPYVEADRLEHALSEELEAKIDAELGFPTHDPHGDPIPDRLLRVEDGRVRTLLDLAPGESATVSRIPDGDPELLRYLAELGLVPGSNVELVSVAPFGGPVTLRTDSGEQAVSRELADRIAAS